MNLDQLDELLDAYLLGDLSPEQAVQLQKALKTDSTARSRFVRTIFIETGLHHLARSEPALLSPRQQRTPGAGARGQWPLGGFPRLRHLALAAVVLVAISALAVLYLARQDSGAFARVASGNVLVDGQSRDRIPEGSTLSVTGPGPAVVHLPDGSLATLDPGTRLTLRGRVDSFRQVLDLTAGGGQFQVPYGGGQFRIDTPVGSVTVLGTQFVAVLRSPLSLFLSVVAGTVRFDRDGSAFILNSGQSRTFGPEPEASLPPAPDPKEAPAAQVGRETVSPQPKEAKPKPQVLDGWIQSVNLEAKTFVLGSKNETRTTFRVAVKNEGNREAAQLLLDGKRVSFEEAIQKKRKASVTFVKVSETDLWVWKVEVTSAAK
jgi:ferric-dicitrate binding protein FerR (iron transport regulator)